MSNSGGTEYLQGACNGKETFAQARGGVLFVMVASLLLAGCAGDTAGGGTNVVETIYEEASSNQTRVMGRHGLPDAAELAALYQPCDPCYDEYKFELVEPADVHAELTELAGRYNLSLQGPPGRVDAHQERDGTGHHRFFATALLPGTYTFQITLAEGERGQYEFSYAIEAFTTTKVQEVVDEVDEVAALAPQIVNEIHAAPGFDWTPISLGVAVAFAAVGVAQAIRMVRRG